MLRAVFILVACLACCQPAGAIILFTKEGRQLNPPSDPAMRRCWDAHGSWHGVTGITIAPNWFITVAHVGSHPGGFFELNGKSYHTAEVVAVPHTDLLLYRINGEFTNWVELWDDTCGQEIRRPTLLLGRGTARGAEISLPGFPSPGWLWGDSDGKLSWGTNEISEVLDAGPDLGPLLIWTWDRSAGETEGTLSSGDSGGGAFLRDNKGQWRLAGIHFDVDPSVGGGETHYAMDENGDHSFFAAVHDGRGLWRGIVGLPFTKLDPDAVKPIPMWAGSTRIQPHAKFIRDVIKPGSTFGSDFRPQTLLSLRKVCVAIAAIAALLTMLLYLRLRRRMLT